MGSIECTLRGEAMLRVCTGGCDGCESAGRLVVEKGWLVFGREQTFVFESAAARDRKSVV